MSAVAPFLYTVAPTVSCSPGKRVSALSGAVSLFLLEMKSFGSSGGGALVGAKDGAVGLLLGMVRARRQLPGSPEARLSPFADTTAMATAVPIATVASAPPPMNSSRRRLLRVSDASASAAQSGVGLVAAAGPRLLGVRFPGSHCDGGPPCCHSSWGAS